MFFYYRQLYYGSTKSYNTKVNLIHKDDTKLECTLSIAQAHR